MAIDPDAEDLFANQWYLDNTGQTGGTPGVDINVRRAWDLASGDGVRIAVNDSGINPDDPDLAPNLDTGVGGNFTTDPPTDAIGPDPDIPGNWHGTGVASMAAADDNGRGFIGAAPDATLASLVGIGEPGALARYQNHDVVNASWGFTELFADDFNLSRLQAAARALAAAAEDGRDGLGTVTVFAAGNDFTEQGFFGIETGVGDANYHNFQNSRHTIAVGALDDDGTFAAPGNPAGFSTPGAPVLVSAPGTEVPTADLPAPDGNNPDGNATVVSGTSFAAPLVSGVSALMLDANPDLGYRDVQRILALTARQNDADQQGWRLNGADTWNGGGLHTNINYGFGLVDAAAAVRLAETWRETSTAANAASVSASRSRPATIDADGQILRQTVTLDAGVDVETVAVDIDLVHEHFGDVTISLTSPDGTRSVLVNQPDSGDFGGFDRQGYRLTSNEFLGESSAGTWTLRIADGDGGIFGDRTTGTLFDWTLSAYGAPADANDTYVYTDEYAAYADADPARATLTDAGGTDTLNAAATSDAVTIDLTAGATSTIAGAPLTIGSTTTIEDAAGGGGGDRLTGNAVANRLTGGPGDDTLSGLGGDDTLLGGRGSDTLDGGAGEDTAVFDAPRDAVTFAPGDGGAVSARHDGTRDVLRDVELADFADAEAVPLDRLVPRPPDDPARVFLAADGAFALGNGAEVFGRAGGAERLTVAGDARGVRLDANVERVDLDAPLDDLTFGVGADGLTIAPTHGVSPMVTLPSLNQPLDLRLADGGASLTQTGAGTFTLAGADGASTTIGRDAGPVALPLTGAAATDAVAGANGAQGRVFLPADGAFTLAAPAQVFGRSGGDERLTLTREATDVDLDANLERLDVPYALDALTWRVAEGGLTATTGGDTLLTMPSLNQPMDVRFTDGDATLAQTGAAMFMLTGGDGGTAEIGRAPTTLDVDLGDAASDPVSLIGTDDPRSDDGGAIG